MANMNNNNDISAKQLLNRIRKTGDEVKAPETDAQEEVVNASDVLAEFAETAPADINTFAAEEIDLDEFVPTDEMFEGVSEDDFAELEVGDIGFEELTPTVDEYAEWADEVPEASATEDDFAALDAEVVEIAENTEVFDNDPIIESAPVDEEAFNESTGEIKDFEALVTEVAQETNLMGELDETDISLMVALGMEDQLAESVGEEDATKLTDDFVADQEEWVDRENRFGEGEYSDMSENRRIAVDYTKKNRFGFLRLLVSIVLTVVILFYENLPVIGYQISGVFDPAVYPIIYVMTGLQLFLFLCAMAYPSMIDGAKNLFAMKFTPSSIAFLSAVSTVVNSIIIASSIVATVEPRLYTLPSAVCILFAVASEYMTNRREIFSFNIVSSRTPKYVMRRLNNRDSQLENQAVSDMDAFDDENSGDIVKIAKTDFVDGYFWRTNNRGTTDKPFILLLVILSFVFTVVMGVYAWLSKADASPVSVALTALSAMLPASALLVGYYPFYKANKIAYYNDCTIIGEGSVEEYSDTEVISFDDINVFPSINVKVRNVRLFNNCRIDKVLYYAASVFSATGGPLQDVFEVATMEIGHSKDVDIVETGIGYIEANVNGRNIIFSREDALLRHGIAIPEEANQDITEKLSPDCSVMYMIYQKRLVAKMTFSYMIDADFEYILRQLADSGMFVCVKTFDPNIDEDIIKRQVAGEGYPLRVIKYKGTEEITKYSARTEGGIVSRGTTKALLQTIAFCDKIVSAKKTGYVLSVASVVLTVLAICFLMMTGGFSSIYSVFLAANQLFWLVPALLSTRSIVR